MKPIACILSLLVCALAGAQTPAYQEYLAQISALQHDSAQIIQNSGRDALIQRYRDLISAYPDYANNIRLETQIAMLYESDFSDKGQPPDMQAAYDTYQQILQNYDADHPYIVTVRQRTADAATEVDPVAAEQMYLGLINDYPDHDAVVVQSHYALAKLAAEQGDPVKAQQEYEKILGYTPSGGKVSEAEQASIEAYRANSVANLLSDAIRGYDTPQERMKAMKKFLEKHQELRQAHAELIERFAKSIERKSGTSNDDDEASAMHARLASLSKGDRGQEPGRKDRERARELRQREFAETRNESFDTASAQNLSGSKTLDPISQGATGPGGVLTRGPAAAIFIAGGFVAAALALIVFLQLRRKRAAR